MTQEQQAEAMMHFTQAVGGGILSLPELADGDWESYAMAAEVTDDSIKVSAYRYTAAGEVLATEPPENDDEFWDLRDATRGPDGQAWDVAVVKVDRATSGMAVEFLAGAGADPYRVEPGTIDSLPELIRPTAADFG
jgi:hypothetical protein